MYTYATFGGANIINGTFSLAPLEGGARGRMSHYIVSLKR